MCFRFRGLFVTLAVAAGLAAPVQAGVAGQGASAACLWSPAISVAPSPADHGRPADYRLARSHALIAIAQIDAGLIGDAVATMIAEPASAEVPAVLIRLADAAWIAGDTSTAEAALRRASGLLTQCAHPSERTRGLIRVVRAQGRAGSWKQARETAGIAVRMLADETGSPAAFALRSKLMGELAKALGAAGRSAVLPHNRPG